MEVIDAKKEHLAEGKELMMMMRDMNHVGIHEK
jgi:hypothetical protein